MPLAECLHIIPVQINIIFFYVKDSKGNFTVFIAVFQLLDTTAIYLSIYDHVIL
ncbi:hypothetical protein MBAV_002628 [Candidatus Magnetobacterium bavaricum]|uniref:Uncharacterized protein n=1 Tax=Candidatus Magnetobacterium bavaricum TaxID=29290 RepID=A0A0F3GWW2_9BACT|nr:hypothetical protein MBAV_002628 [Candidatus Magnetobacterium bavaricum]